MPDEEALYMRDQLRAARALVFEDAEAFSEVAFVLERWGSRLSQQVDGLKEYKEHIRAFAKRSALAAEIPQIYPLWHSEFETLYELVREARNDAMHQGAFVRHVAENAIQLSLILEDGLMDGAERVGDFMVREPSCAMAWQPLSYIRQLMLKNAFTYLPYLEERDGAVTWKLVSDYHLAYYLRTGNRKQLLAKTLSEAIAGGLTLSDVKTCTASTHVAEAIKTSRGLPLLVIDRESKERLIGIVSPFDLL